MPTDSQSPPQRLHSRMSTSAPRNENSRSPLDTSGRSSASDVVRLDTTWGPPSAFQIEGGAFDRILALRLERTSRVQRHLVKAAERIPRDLAQRLNLAGLHIDQLDVGAPGRAPRWPGRDAVDDDTRVARDGGGAGAGGDTSDGVGGRRECPTGVRALRRDQRGGDGERRPERAARDELVLDGLVLDGTGEHRWHIARCYTAARTGRCASGTAGGPPLAQAAGVRQGRLTASRPRAGHCRCEDRRWTHPARGPAAKVGSMRPSATAST